VHVRVDSVYFLQVRSDLAENPRGGAKIIAYDSAAVSIGSIGDDFIKLGAWPLIGRRHGREQVLAVLLQ